MDLIKENRCYLAASISCVHMIANVVGNPGAPR